MNYQKKILDNLNSAILVFNAALALEYINTSGEILFEDSAKHLLNKTVTEIFSYNPIFIDDLKQLLTRGEGFVSHGFVLNLQQKNMTLNLSVTPLYNDDHSMDIVIELQKVDRHLRISKEEQLISQQQTTQMLMRGFAHEIKNPLGGLRGAAQLLACELASDELKEYTGIIIAEADRMKCLMDKMLGPNKLPQKQLLNIHEPLERVRHLVQAEVAGYIAVQCDYDPSIPEVFADKNQLIQVFLNIARNAAQAIEDNGLIIFRTRIVRYMTVLNKLHKLTVRVDIIDNGVGIKPELIEKIFYPMITGKEDGTGLGLTIAQSIMNQYNGFIAYSDESNTTIFSIFLPIK